MSHNNLSQAKINKNDEFYTQYKDIENEISAYIQYNKDIFRDKIVLCPCDDYRYSNFTKYFLDNFDNFGLKRLISTCYNKDGNGIYFIKTRDNHFKGFLKGDGDFNSCEVTGLKNKSDFIITNPPFSLFRRFMDWVIIGNKRFSIIGHLNAVKYKELFPLMMSNEIWLGSQYFNGGATHFVMPSYLFDISKLSNEKYSFVRNGKIYCRVNGVRWFTNIEHNKRNSKLNLKKKYSENEYPKFDSCDVINVNKVYDIPCDYSGTIGVPISFFDKYCSNQFEIVGLKNNPKINGKPIYSRILIKNKHPEI